MSFIEAKIKVPASGNTDVLNVAGRSVIVAGVGSFDALEDYPQFSFDTEGAERQRAGDGNVYQNAGGKFSKIIVHGSDSASGTEIIFFITNACLTPDIDPDSFLNTLATFGDQQSQAISVTDIFSFSSITLIDDDGNLPRAVYIGALDFDIRYANNIDPSASTGFILTAGSDPIKIEGINLIQNLRFANESTGGAADATLTYFFEY